MAKSKDISLNLPSVDDLFSTQEERDATSREEIVSVARSLIDPFPNHPFHVKHDDEMRQLVESIEQYGVLSPTILRPKEDGRYEMIAGHRRMEGSALAGLGEVPAIIKNLTDDEAIILMVDSNLQREHISPSEKAFAYKLKMDAMKRQSGRPSKQNGAPVEPQLIGVKSRDILASESNDSREQIRRYIRLTNLIEPILNMVDEGKIAFRPAVELSYLSQEEQEYLLETMECEVCTPSLAQAIKMKNFAKEGKLSEEVIRSILQEEKPNQVEQVKIPKPKIEKYFPKGTSKQTMEDTIVKALDLYQKRNRDRER